MQRLKAEQTAKRVIRLALGESIVILALLVALTLQYENNLYMQEWIASHFWPGAWLLNGTLVGLMTGLIGGWMIATWQGRRSREQKILDDLRKIV